MQFDVSVRIIVAPHEPGRRASHGESELFVELPVECRALGLSGLDLAARKFPIPRVDLARWALREEHLTVGAHDHGRGDARDRTLLHVAPQGTVVHERLRLSAAAPA